MRKLTKQIEGERLNTTGTVYIPIIGFNTASCCGLAILLINFQTWRICFHRCLRKNLKKVLSSSLAQRKVIWLPASHDGTRPIFFFPPPSFTLSVTIFIFNFWRLSRYFLGQEVFFLLIILLTSRCLVCDSARRQNRGDRVEENIELQAEDYVQNFKQVIPTGRNLRWARPKFCGSLLCWCIVFNSYYTSPASIYRWSNNVGLDVYVWRVKLLGSKCQFREIGLE